MDDLSSHFPQPAPEQRDNLTRLLNLGRQRRVRVNRRYSFFVRGLQILLPVIALGIVVIAAAWPKMDDTISAIPREEVIPQKTGQNELITPRYESADSNGNPYIITAARAVQSLEDSAAIMLDKPVAQVTLKGGETLSGQSSAGTYRQKDNILDLTGDIILTHSNGYTLTASQLEIGVKSSTATSMHPVALTGPAGTLQAEGMAADNASGTIIFTGPAKLTLKKAIKGL